MKVTAILPEELINEIKKYSNGKNITDSLRIALSQWLQLQHIIELNNRLKTKPLQFSNGFSANKIRELNRRS